MFKYVTDRKIPCLYRHSSQNEGPHVSSNIPKPVEAGKSLWGRSLGLWKCQFQPPDANANLPQHLCQAALNDVNMTTRTVKQKSLLHHM